MLSSLVRLNNYAAGSEETTEEEEPGMTEEEGSWGLAVPFPLVAALLDPAASPETELEMWAQPAVAVGEKSWEHTAASSGA